MADTPRIYDVAPNPIERNLYIAVNALNETFNNPKFPQELAPPDDWHRRILLEDNNDFEREFVRSMTEERHPVRRSGEFSEQIESFARNIRAWVPPGRKEIHLRKDDVNTSSPGDLSLLLSHEIAHYLSPVVESDSPLSIEDQRLAMVNLERIGFVCDPSQLRLRMFGLFEAVTLDGKRVTELPKGGKFWNDFFNELYADIYKVFVSAHMVSVKGRMPFKQSVALMRKSISREAPDGEYNRGLIDYAGDVGWEDIIKTGIGCDLDKFLAISEKGLGKSPYNFLGKLKAVRKGFSGR